MLKTLCIAIPTYNRAHLLDAQLTWVAAASKGLESRVELIISDNCSTDQTPEIIAKWKAQLGHLDIQHVRHPQNQGAIKNIAYCINSAQATYVWVVSDDDRVDDSAARKVLETVAQYPDLGLMMLNYSCYESATEKLVYEQRYHLDQDEWNSDGKAFFEKYLAIDYGGLILTTALVYRTNLAQESVAQWQAGLGNIMFQLYITAFCARGGTAFLTQKSLIQWMSGRAFFSTNIDFFIQIQLDHMQTIYIKLAELGYSQKLCRHLVIKRITSMEWLTLALKMSVKHPRKATQSLQGTCFALWSLWFRPLNH